MICSRFSFLPPVIGYMSIEFQCTVQRFPRRDFWEVLQLDSQFLATCQLVTLPLIAHGMVVLEYTLFPSLQTPFVVVMQEFPKRDFLEVLYRARLSTRCNIGNTRCYYGPAAIYRFPSTLTLLLWSRISKKNSWKRWIDSALVTLPPDLIYCAMGLQQFIFLQLLLWSKKNLEVLNRLCLGNTSPLSTLYYGPPSIYFPSTLAVVQNFQEKLLEVLNRLCLGNTSPRVNMDLQQFIFLQLSLWSRISKKNSCKCRT